MFGECKTGIIRFYFLFTDKMAVHLNDKGR